MPSLDEIKKQISGLDGYSKMLAFKEIKELPSILWEDEKVEKVIQGMYDKGLGLLVATNKRLIFIDKGLIWGLRVEDFSYSKITSIQYDTGMLKGKIIIFCAGNKSEIDQTDKKQTRLFGDFVRAKISHDHEPASANHVAAALQQTNDNLIDKLERLSKLKDQGVLTEQEFNQQKQILLSSNKEPRFCTSCGNQVQPEWKFCPFCTKPL